MINLSFEQRVFAEALKTSIFVPILKKQNCFDIEKYILSVCSKIIEKFMKIRMLNYLNSINFHHEFKFDITKSKSTEDALLDFTNNIYESMSNNKTNTIFIDFWKAFDFVCHEKLLDKMQG